MSQAIPCCLRLETHLIFCAFSLALASAGSSMLARMAMIAMTTSNSIRVKPRRARGFSPSPPSRSERDEGEGRGEEEGTVAADPALRERRTMLLPRSACTWAVDLGG